MSQIITITLNPAIDKSTSIAELVPDKKLKCSQPLFQPGGGGVNVARAIKRLGGNARALYLAGGYTGIFFTQLLEEEGITSVVIDIRGHTRENLIVVEESSNRQYRFGMPGPSVNENEWMHLLQVLEEEDDISFFVASGAVPAGIPLDIFGRIAGIAKEKNARFLLDSSGEALKQGLDKGVYLIKPNLGELCSLAGKEWIDISEVENVAKQIIREKNVEVIVVSMGEAGAMLVTQHEAFKITPPTVERKSTVGAGDSMVAGIVTSLSKGMPIKEAVQYGVACGTAATMNPGTELCHLEDAEKLFAIVKKQNG